MPLMTTERNARDRAQTIVEIPLSAWTSTLDATGRIDGGGLLQFRDGSTHDWHLLQAQDGRFAEDWLTARVVFRPSPTCTALFHVNLPDGRLRVACSVDKQGRIVDRGVSESARCEARADGFLALEVTYYNVSQSIAVGSIAADGPYPGLGTHQFDIESITVEIDRPDQVEDDAILLYIDVGARFGRNYELKQMRRKVRVVMFEPDPDGAAPLVEEAAKYPGTVVVQRALYCNHGLRTLFITEGAPCSSLLVPNHEFLKDYNIGRAFRVDRTIQVDCVRYDSLFATGDVPKPDAIKIDVQGCEAEVLEGFGGLLSDCIGVELETHVYPIYNGQKLLTDITQFLERFDLMLVRLTPQLNFGSDLVEFNAWFLKRPSWYEGRSPFLLEKLATLKRIWFL